jgi:ketosteroid isomerase-like protein
MPLRFAVFILAGFVLSAETPPAVPDIGAIWGADWSAKRLDHVLTVYAQDAIFFTTDGDQYQGVPAIRDFFQKTLATNDPTIHMHRSASWQSGKIAYESGEYQETIVSGGHQIDAHGHYLLVLRNENERWLIVEQMWTGVTSSPH